MCSGGDPSRIRTVAKRLSPTLTWPSHTSITQVWPHTVIGVEICSRSHCIADIVPDCPKYSHPGHNHCRLPFKASHSWCRRQDALPDDQGTEAAAVDDLLALLGEEGITGSAGRWDLSEDEDSGTEGFATIHKPNTHKPGACQ